MRLDHFLTKHKFATSNSHARQLLKESAVKINNNKTTDNFLDMSEFTGEVRVGKVILTFQQGERVEPKITLSQAEIDNIREHMMDIHHIYDIENHRFYSDGEDWYEPAPKNMYPEEQ